MNIEEKSNEQSQDINIQNSEDKINLLGKSTTISINPVQKIEVIQDKFGITSTELENVVSNYTDLNNKTTLLESIELLGGTKGIIQKLNSSETEGIKGPFEQRIENFGINKIFEEPPSSFIKFLKESLSELMIVILLSAAIIQIIIGLTISDQKKTGWLDGASVLFAVFVVVTVESFTNWQKEKKFFELNNLKNVATYYKTIRNKVKQDTKSEDLLVGDIIYISTGDSIPADLLLIESNGIKIDENALTGESRPVSKEPFDICIKNQTKKNLSPIILSGTDCVEGNAKAVVIGVGERSTKGKIQRLVDNSKDEKSTPLEEKLDVLAKKIGIFAISAGVLTFLCLSLRLSFIFYSDYKYYKHKLHHDPAMNLVHPKTYLFPRILENFMITTVIITIALPEGLPMAVALTLAFSLKKLMDKNNLVRKMHSCETMGGANYILTDKTGTLTTNELSVVKILNIEQSIDITDDNLNQNKYKIYIDNKDIRENAKKYFKNEKYWNLLRKALSLNVDAHINFLNEPNINGDLEQCDSKNKTDHALIEFLYRVKSPISETEKKIVSKKQIPFDSNKKRMTTYVQEKNDIYRLYTKGGSENIKNFCKYYINSQTGEKEKLTQEILENIESKIENCNNNMLRTLYICYKDIAKEEFENIDINLDDNLDKTDLILLAIVGIRDTIRKGVKEAVLKCKEASINVIMVTGDNIQTAHSIAKECNIIDNGNDNKLIMDIKNEEEKLINNYLNNPPVEINGDIFYDIIGGIYCSTCGKSHGICTCPKTYAEAELISDNLNLPIQSLRNDKIKNLSNFKKIISNLKIMARSKPIHKYALVLGLKELNYIVAVTGDGTNDAPALSKSDVGFSMFNGTDIAKNSSDIILMDNNFSSIVTAIKYGRNIIDNLRKFIQFQLVINLTVCSFIVICSCIGSETPIRSIQMLWIGLIMDSLATLTLATEPPHDGLLKRSPTKRNENIITQSMIKHVYFQTFVQFFILIYIYLFGPIFIDEQNIARLAENKLILKCYGVLPGNMLDPGKIIYGIKTYWPNFVEIDKNSVAKGICGEYANYNNLSKALQLYNKHHGAPVQLTMIFNVFVLYTLFNQINCRIVDGSFNIFARMKNNKLFIFFEMFEFVVQFIIIEFWNVVFKATKNGLTLQQWGICILLSSSSFVVDFILKIKF